MHAQRFWSYFLLSLFLGWAVLGAYPIGTPLSGISSLSEAGPLQILHLVGLFAMTVVSVVGMVLCLYVLFYLGRFATVEAVRDASGKWAPLVSRLAPFGMFGIAALIVRIALGYQLGQFTGLQASVLIAIAMLVLFFIVVVAGTVIFIHRPPDE